MPTIATIKKKPRRACYKTGCAVAHASSRFRTENLIDQPAPGREEAALKWSPDRSQKVERIELEAQKRQQWQYCLLRAISSIREPHLDNEPGRSGEGQVFNRPSASQPEQLLANHRSHHKSLMDNNNHLALVCGCPVLVRAPLHY
jgi:hypothetical protein